jgi:PAS domain S-box-containing protein
MPPENNCAALKKRIEELEKELEKRIRSEKRLATSKEMYTKIVENVNTGILVAQDARLVFVNPGIAEFLGYSQEELLSHPNPFEFIHPEDVQMVFERHMRRLEGENVPQLYSYRVVTKDGRVKWVEVTGVQIAWDNRPATLNFFINITEQKEAELALQHSEERYRSLVENTMDGIYIAELPSGKFIFLNQRACDLFGYGKEDGLACTIWDIISPEGHEKAKQRIDLWLQKPDLKLDSVVYSVTRKDGSSFLAEVSSSMVTYKGKQVIQGTVRDITEKQSLQNQLQQAQRLESIGTLAGGVAHDFNNILTGIQGQVSLMLLNSNWSHPFTKNLKDIVGYVKRAVDLTRQLLDFARGGKYEVQPTNLNLLVEESARMFGRTKKEIEIALHMEPDPWIVAVDQRQIEQVLLNLYVNAWQAMPDGGKLFLQTENIVIDEQYKKPFQVVPGNYVRLSVTDTGIGMDGTTRQKIFEPFFTTKEMGRGTGLGLASAYGIVKNHDGIINVYSEPGHGTTFCIYLPATEGEVIEEQPNPVGLSRGRGSLLLVDDEKFIIDIGKQMLESLGYRVYIAGNGQSAVDLYRRNQDEIQLVILDMIMPGMNGVKTYDRLKNLNPEVKVLLASGYSINRDVTELLERGCDGFIQKPFDICQLSRKVNEVLQE